jgi:hypothetical protein
MAHFQILVLQNALSQLVPCEVLELVVADPELLEVLDIGYERVQTLARLRVDVVLVQVQLLQFLVVNYRLKDRLQALIPDAVEL